MSEIAVKGVPRDVIEKHIAATLDINRFRDYCPNGLQVEGRSLVRRVVSGVTANLALLEAAAPQGPSPTASTLDEEAAPVHLHPAPRPQAAAAGALEARVRPA